MAAARTKTPTIGSAQWVLDERQHSQDLVAQELEDFGFSVRNELEWLNEHMAEILSREGQNNLDVFKTPGKLRGKTPRTARKGLATEVRQPLSDIFMTNSQHLPSPAQNSLKSPAQRNAPKARFKIAEDMENASPIRTPKLKSPIPRSLFATQLGQGKENRDTPRHVATTQDHALPNQPTPLQYSPKISSQDTEMATQDADDVFSQGPTQTSQFTQPTQPTASFRRSLRLSAGGRRDTGESFVSAKEALGSRRASNEHLRDESPVDAMDVDTVQHQQADPEPVKTMTHVNTESIREAQPVRPRARVSEQYSIGAETQAALHTAIQRSQAPEPKVLIDPDSITDTLSDPMVHNDDTVLHNDIGDHMDVDEDVRSPSDGSSPVKPLVRKSSLTFASLPAREPLIAKKSMGNRVSRTSQVDQSRIRSSNMGRFTGGRSLGATQHTQLVESAENVGVEQAVPRQEESESAKMHNLASTKTLKERLNLLSQRTEPPKRVSQNIAAPSMPQPPIASSSQVSQPMQVSQPVYPHLSEHAEDQDEDEEDDWIAPVRTAPAPIMARPLSTKVYAAETQASIPEEASVPKVAPASNSDLPLVEESTTPAGSPTLKRHPDGPLSASKAKFYSALRAAKEKIIGSSATSAQVKLDTLAENASRPKLPLHSSSDDSFASPKRNEKGGASIFAHLRSPSKESIKSNKSSKLATSSSSPVRDDGRRTRSSSERERQKERDLREKEAKQKQRAEERLREMREKEQSKAAAQHQKAKAAAKTPMAISSQTVTKQALSVVAKTPAATSQPPQSRPGTVRANTATRQQDQDSADDMPPPPPKGLLPAGTGHKLREPKRLVKAPSKDTIPKGKPQKIQVNLHRDRFGQAPPAPKPTTTAPPKMAPPTASKPTSAASKPAAASTSRPTAASRLTSMAPKPAPRLGRTQPIKAAEKPKAPPPSQPRADLPAARPVSRLQTVQDANRINIPPINPAKPPVKRPFQTENDETLHRPAKRPSQQARSKPVTPAHAQFAHGKIPFAESSQSAQPPTQYPNGEDIKLPDIMTDSEDEDSDNDFEQPSWVNTPNLRNMLEQQQLVDPEQIFGPIAPLNMEQVFPNKERHKRFRDRTSSAYWANDQVTEEERRKEREARERLVREGAWTYNPSPRPGTQN
ncbi:uncharacterized protein EI97DRAFT_421893 [Westerdykella ornata]|uniref:Inner centromere protein ARK-binding domain-containing protein n=1 Tax=Westerdykella ornata TaxID=318751 RepID=A0A6A6JE69_WESOR|nr:uncharacterized protein EI97DRAFT_421893 [Westerdykella ornata]KAF2274712.1 hypothetical protein EI97DRAFT_421893 [Westerdykella ornata]